MLVILTLVSVMVELRLLLKVIRNCLLGEPETVTAPWVMELQTTEGVLVAVGVGVAVGVFVNVAVAVLVGVFV